MSFRLDASYQLDVNNSIGANFGFLRNPKQTCEANMATEIWQDEDQTESSDSHANSFEQKSTLSSNVYYVGKIGKLGIRNMVDIHLIASFHQLLGFQSAEISEVV